VARLSWLMVLALLAPLTPAVAQTAPAVRSGVEHWKAGDWAGAVAAWQGPAAAGDADAMFNMGQAYKLGRGVPADPAQARDWYRKAAAKGHLPAQTNLGILLFQSGEKAEAMRWLKSAADRGEPRAQYVFGIATYNGDGTPRSPGTAYGYLLRASSKGLTQATQALASIEGGLSPADRAAGEAVNARLAAGQAPDGSVPAKAPAITAGSAPPTVAPAVKPAQTMVTTAAAAPPPVKPATPPVAPATGNPAPAKPPAATPAASTAAVTSTPAAATPPPASVVAAPPSVTTAQPRHDEPSGVTVKSVDIPAATPAPVVPKPATPATAAPAAAPPVTKPAVATATPSATPSPSPAAKTAGAAPAPKPAPPKPEGWYVQLGAFSKRTQAEAAWEEVKTQNKDAVKGVAVHFDPGGSITKLQLGPLADKAKAKDLCARLAFAGRSCFVTQD
jgi:cell division septation protein DedD